MTSFLKCGDIAEVDIDDIAFGGEGVCRIKDMVVFVPFTVGGDKAIVEIVATKRRYARGKIVRLIVPSRERAIPKCRYYALCGGCQYQHVRYDTQLAIKRRHVIDAFVRLGKFVAPPVADTIHSPQPFGYRGKAEFQVARERSGRWVSGFMHNSSHRVIDIDSCAIVDDSINESYGRFRREILGRKEAVKRQGKWIFWSKVELPDAAHLEREAVVRLVNGTYIMVSEQGFFQANTGLAGRFVDEVISMCNLTGRETVLDAYCGSGLFTLFLASGAKSIYGIEMDPEAVRYAQINLRDNGCSNAVVMNGDVAEMMKNKVAAAAFNMDVFVCDPPRVGLSPEVRASIIEMKPARIVYVSCNPATQARDMGELARNGYVLKKLQPIDMFPQTAHIEVVGLMERQDVNG
jgi:23S rRNA (uracil1939-C5)-methyltransferase